MDEKQIREVAARIEAEWQMSGLTGGLYEDFAFEVAKLAVSAERERCLNLARYALSCAKNTEWSAAEDALDRIEGPNVGVNRRA